MSDLYGMKTVELLYIMFVYYGSYRLHIKLAM
uniref:Uncharacterized protein n=1 Tax=Arundo donax TaxID=35708 RepID=A0A0A8YBS8_ARUDO